METKTTMKKKLLTIQEASKWASDYLDRDITPSNISYLIQYGKVRRHNGDNKTLVSINDLEGYYLSYNGKREVNWKKKLGEDLNWTLSFDHLREKDTTKHVHRLHPYKGKFIPQLVEYFIDEHKNHFKTKSYFKKGDIILDPFSGSGTALVQANELGIHSIGIDVSQFNNVIAEVKLQHYDMESLEKEVEKIRKKIAAFETDIKIKAFENELYEKMGEFNSKYFPSPSFKYKLHRGQIKEDKYAKEKESNFLAIYNKLVKKYGVKLKQNSASSFLDQWYSDSVRKEIDFAFSLVKKIKDAKNKKILAVILSRTIRSCRATTHSDLGTLKEPQLTTYYCYKHKKICKPIFSIKKMFSRYATDTIQRLKEFDKLRTSAHSALISDDSRTADINIAVKKINQKFHKLLAKQKIKGIFTSPPYVGQIDYHEQHSYAYDLFNFKRKDELEIGSLYKGQGEDARRSYVEGISNVLQNCRKHMVDNFDVFLVANDKYNLYPKIAERSNMKIVKKFKRPVLNRTERDKLPYSEIIFYLKENKN